MYVIYQLLLRLPPRYTLFPYTTLFRSAVCVGAGGVGQRVRHDDENGGLAGIVDADRVGNRRIPFRDRKSTRLNSSHPSISYAVFCLKKKNTLSSISL